MNRILETYIDDFKEQYGLKAKSESELFEYFCAFCIASKSITDDTITKDNLNEIVTGSGNDWGIDGFLIKVNNKLVDSVETLENLLKFSLVLQVDITLIQTKTSESIDFGEFKKFLAGSRCVVTYLNNRGFDKLPLHNKSIEDKLLILDRIFQKASSFPPEGKYRMPLLNLYYMHSGSNKGNGISETDFNDNLNFIQSKNLFNVGDWKILNDNDIRSYYEASKKRLERKLVVDQHLPLPEVENISESHLCLIPFREFRKLITSDEDGSMLRQIFEDNVRDFQGTNRVNAGIEKTLKDGELRLFTALNNGITIIAREIRFVGKELTLKDYQIVNGCQTCHVLYDNCNIEGIDELILSVKIIASNDKEIRDKIIIANNSQTEVKREQLLSLLEAQRNIEAYYLAQKKFTKLYYERRSKQYRYGVEEVTADKVVTIAAQIHAFVSMISGKPHLNRSYYGKIIEQVNVENKGIFEDNIKPAFYYTCALAAHERTRCFDTGVLPKEYTSVKHHLLLALRLVAIPKEMPDLGSNRAQQYCDELCEVLSDKNKCDDAFRRAAKLIRNALGREPQHNDLNDAGLTSAIMRVFHNDKTKYFTTARKGNSELKDNKRNDSKDAVVSPTKQTKPEIHIVGKIDLDALSFTSRKSLKRKPNK